MKENSIKEDIERLKLCSTNQCHICGRYEKEECILERNRCEQHLLSDYKRVLKENEELNKYTIHLTDEQYKTVIDLAQNDINQQWIQKVKDKIEEILNNGEYRIIFEGDAEFPDEATRIDAKKYIKLEKLQELLEGRK